MGKLSKFIIFAFIAIDVLLIGKLLLNGSDIQVLNPQGIISSKERNLILLTTFLMLIVVIPVFILTIFIALRYREGNLKAKYDPDFDHSNKLEVLWWTIPLIMILILAIITWINTYALDPYKKIVSKNPPMTIQVVALDWKWLFIYPKENIATVSLVEFPRQTPITFVITSDAPMNSFWIPSLSGQIYAMPGMSTQLNLMANGNGDYHGYSANISGKGFSGMTFTAKSVDKDEFNNWVQMTREKGGSLNFTSYNSLAKPSEYNPVSYYNLTDHNLYNKIIDKYMMPKVNMPM